MSFKKAKIGEHELYYGDCLEVIPIILKENYVVITDPPYGKDLQNHDKTGRTRKIGSYQIRGDKNQDVGIKMLDFCSASPVITFASPMLPWPGKWRQFLVWDKGEAVGGGGDVSTCLKFDWELIQVSRTGKINGRRDSSVLRFHISSSNYKLHPTAKPVSLMRYLIEKYTNENDVIFDPFMGSGTTGEACINLNRRFIGIEKDKKYFKIAYHRLKEAHEEALSKTVQLIEA